MVASLVLGGGTRGGFASDALLQLIAIPLLVLALWRMRDVPAGTPGRLALWLCLAIALVPVLQLVPLPPAAWTALPRREVEAAAFELIVRELPWMPLSVAPSATALGALALIPPVALFLGTCLLGYRQRRLLALVLLGVGLVSLLLGLLQVAQGPTSPLRFFAFTNTADAVGFFANRNHFAALLYVLTLFAAAFAFNAAVKDAAIDARRRTDTAAIAVMIASFAVLVALIGGQLMARSRAGLGLTIVALVGALALAISDRRSRQNVTPARLIFAATAVALLFATQFALYRVFERFTADPLEDARLRFASTTLEAARAYLPFGSGIGSFVPVYAINEKREDLIANVYANHAHNDWLEVWLETGVVGLALMGLFALWWVGRAARVWRPGAIAHAPRRHAIDVALARAATLAIALLLVHSLVDYPLRTGAMMAVFAFAAALLTEPMRSADADPRQATRQDDGRQASDVGREPSIADQSDARAARHADARAMRDPGRVTRDQIAEPVSDGAPPRQTTAPPRHEARSRPGTIERWGEQVEWPEAWRQPSGSKASNDDTATPKPKPTSDKPKPPSE